MHVIDNGLIKSTYESARIATGSFQHCIVVQGDVPVTSKSPYQRSLVTLARPSNHDDGRIDEGGLHLIDGEPRK